MTPPAWNADLRSARAARPRSARHDADLRDGSLSRCNRAERTLPDLCRPGRPAAHRPRAFGPLRRPESSYCENAVPRVGPAPRWRRRLGTPTSGRHALRDRAAHGTAPTCGMVLCQCNRAEGTFPDLRRPRRLAARRPRAFGPLCRPESSYCENAVQRVGRAPRWCRRLGTPTSGRQALRDRAAHGTAPTCGMVLSRCNRAEGTFPDLCRPGRPAARRPRAFGPLCRPEVGVPSRFRLSRQAGCAGGPDHRLLRHVPRQPIPPQRHVHPAGPATATCTWPTDPASATCASRRTPYCDMCPPSRILFSDMCPRRIGYCDM